MELLQEMYSLNNLYKNAIRCHRQLGRKNPKIGRIRSEVDHIINKRSTSKKSIDDVISAIRKGKIQEIVVIFKGKIVIMQFEDDFDKAMFTIILPKKRA